MTCKIPVSDLKISLLSLDRDITHFDCGNDDLNDFICSDAKDQMKSRMNTTYISSYKDKIIAYFTLSSDSIKINREDQEYIGLKYSAYPAVKIGRLAVDKEYVHRGIGSIIILWVIGLALDLCDQIGYSVYIC